MQLVRLLVRSPLVVLAGIEGVALFCVPSLVRGLLGRHDSVLWMGHNALYAGLLVSALLSVGLYSRQQRATLSGVLVRVWAALLAGSAFIGLVSFLWPRVAVPRDLFVLAFLTSTTLICVLRIVFHQIVDDTFFKRRVLVLGTGVRAMSLSGLRRRSDQRGFSIQGYLRNDGEQSLVPADLQVQAGEDLLAWCRAQPIDEIVVALDDRRSAFPVQDLLNCRLAGIHVIELVDFLERETGKVRLDVLNPSWIIFGDGFSLHAWRDVTRRAFDIAFSLALLCFAWPLMLLAVLIIKLTEGPRAPVLYRQSRVGLEGRCFDVLKFRSMRTDAERAGAQWAVKNDSRVTPFGAFMRKTRIDELPQILNVLKGDMAFVGPRPERPEFVAGLEQRIPYYRERHAVKPGITGWAQLCYPYGASERDALEKLQYDLYYIKNHTLIFDFLILLQTVEVVLWGRGR